MEYNIGGDIASDISFDNEDHQEQQLRIGSDSSNTDDHSLPKYESGSEGDFDLDGNAEIDPSSKDVTKGAVLSLIFALLVKHRLTKSCLGDLYNSSILLSRTVFLKRTIFRQNVLFRYDS